MDWSAASEHLNAKLDPKHVKPPSKFGPKGDYIEGWWAIAEANRIFGHGGWSYEILSLTKEACEKGQNRDGKDQWQAAYTCLVRVRVDTVTREDVGFGSGFAAHIGDAIEGATKEAVTDALKRALRTFGNPFGLALYDKSRENVGVNPPPFNAGETRDRLIAAIHKQDTIDGLNKFWGNRAVSEALDKLPDVMADAVRKARETRIGYLGQAPADEKDHAYG